MSTYLITKNDVHKIDCRPITRSEYPGESYSVWIYETSANIVIKKTIGFTETLLTSRRITEEDKLVLAMKLGGQLYSQGVTQDQASITFDNFENVQGKKENADKIDNELLKLIATFFKIQFDTTMHLSVVDLFISTEFRMDDIKKRLLYFDSREWIKQVRPFVFKITSKGFEEAESHERGKDIMKNADNRYFQIVSLSKKVKEPFVFVLMPLKEEEMEQKIYFEVIKPTIEKEFSLICLRADEETKPGVINNQIFTLITKAKCIIAETTTRNPNVFYEVGMAHAFNKDVFIFNNSNKKDLPFDIITNRAVFYDNYDDLKKKVIENLKYHV
jgi:hypothetical protein